MHSRNAGVAFLLKIVPADVAKKNSRDLLKNKQQRRQ